MQNLHYKKGKMEINEMEEPTYLFNPRKDNPGFQEYGGLSDRMAAIAKCLSSILLFVAAFNNFYHHD